jgi:hypothetical protein
MSFALMSDRTFSGATTIQSDEYCIGGIKGGNKYLIHHQGLVHSSSKYIGLAESN